MNESNDPVFVRPKGSHWEIKRGKDALPVLFYFAKEDAVEAGRRIARAENLELVIEPGSQPVRFQREFK